MRKRTNTKSPIDNSDDEAASELKRTLSDLFGTAKKYVLNEEELAATAAAEAAANKVTIEPTAEMMESLTQAAAQAAEEQIGTFRKQVLELEERMDRGNAARMDAVRGGFSKLADEQENVLTKLSTSQLRTEAVHDALMQLDAEHSALLLSQKRDKDLQAENHTTYFSAVDHIVDVCDVLQAAVQRQEAMTIELSKKVTRMMSMVHASVNTKAFAPSSTNSEILRIDHSNNNNNNDSENNAFGSREYMGGEEASTSMSNGKSLIADQQSRAAGVLGPESTMFSGFSNKPANVDALLAPDLAITSIIDSVLTSSTATAPGKAAKGISFSEPPSQILQPHPQPPRAEAPKVSKKGIGGGGKGGNGGVSRSHRVPGPR
jgi:hypothetical protein